MAAAAAAILQSALRIDEQEVQYRRIRAKNLLDRVTDSYGVSPVRPISGGESGYLRLALIDTAGYRLPRASIGALRGYPMTLDQHPQLQPMLMPGERAGKGAEFLRDRLFTLPTHSRVTQSDLQKEIDNKVKEIERLRMQRINTDASEFRRIMPSGSFDKNPAVKIVYSNQG